MIAWTHVAAVYLWGGLTLLLALELFEEIAGALNAIAEPLGMKRMPQFIQGRRSVRFAVVLLWPVAVFLWWPRR